MAQYLLTIKSKVDSLAATGVQIDSEDIIHHTLNVLLASYQAFKTTIRTNLQPLSLDDFYTLLCSEELNLAHEVTRDLSFLQLAGQSIALAAPRGRGRERSNLFRGRSSYVFRNPQVSASSTRGGRTTRPPINCQICGKLGHSTIKCWYCHDPQYNIEPSPALFKPDATLNSLDWYLDSGASSHLMSDPSYIQASQPYTGSNQVIMGNGQQIPIQNTGKGLLLTPAGTLQLFKLHHVPNLSFNLLSVHRLTTDNSCDMYFSSNGYIIKDRETQQPLLQGSCINGHYPLHIQRTAPLSIPHLALISV
ncbi:hypothetical protein MA16_Dca005703 [Dendrobium catenatum]|uniref:Retrovirus-related Pol polyprotein from transposon TNT 1-94-like beta-barrel domain-containing protein n=1 Tax=Dendrobium catenatum TaxID=906689 RepID=A0A2I0WQF1_9ASPA|nr:hypothetical protein MA16_Dca005703 [Dendrobium catenatum]